MSRFARIVNLAWKCYDTKQIQQKETIHCKKQREERRNYMTVKISQSRHVLLQSSFIVQRIQSYSVIPEVQNYERPYQKDLDL